MHISLHSLIDTGVALPNIDDVLIFEVIRPVDFHILIFGAGHVGSALAGVLANSLSCEITLADTRSQRFAEELPEGVNPLVFEDSKDITESIKPGSYCLIMTHSHQLDQELCQALLSRDDLAFVGLIGSSTKLKRFQKRLLDSGISHEQLHKLCCPIGINGINDKTPGAIALSVAAQLQQLYELNKSKMTQCQADDIDVRAR